MYQEEDVYKIVELFEHKYELCTELKQSMLALKKSVQDGEINEVGVMVGKGDQYMKEIDKVDKQVSQNKNLLSTLFRDEDNDYSHLVRTNIVKLQGILEEISGIHKECLSSVESKTVELKQNISSIRRGAQAFRSYVPRPNPPPRFVDTAR